MNKMKRNVSLLTGLIAAASCCFAEEAKPIATVTQVKPGDVSVPRLTPKPLAVAGVAKPVLDLCGQWRFNFDVKEDAWRGEVDFEKWREITVPGQWTAQGYWLKQDKDLRTIYTRIVDIPSDWAGQRIKLRFDGLVGPAWVYINGQEVGVRQGFLRQPEDKGFFTEQWGTSFTPFEWDVTSTCKPGAQNRLVVVMARSYDLYDHPDAGGILRPVRLLAVPLLNLSSFHVSTELDDAYQDAVVKAEVELTREDGASDKNLSVAIRIIEFGKDNKTVAQKRVDVPALDPAASRKQVIEIPVQAPAKWDPEHPHLYLAQCVLLADGKERMRCERRFGFREVEVRGKQFLVNGVAVKARGVNRHETHPILGRGLTDKLYKHDAETFRASNVNFIRTSHYPPDERFIDACDEAGILVEVEAPMWGWFWGPANLGVPLDDEKGRLMRRSTLDMVQRDRSHPSVVLWSLANECEWNAYFAANREAVKALDPTRPTVFDHSFYQTKGYDRGLNDVAAAHYAGEAIFTFAPKEKRPVFLGEYAHLNCYNKEELGYDPGLRALWGPDFVTYWERVYASPDIMGGTIWCGQDSVFFLETSGNLGTIEQNFGLDKTFTQTAVAQPGASVFSTGCGPWGVFDAWRRAKPEQWYVKAAYAPIQLPSPVLALGRDSDTAELVVENRNHFSKLSEFRFEWSAGTRKGVGRADVAAQAKGTLTLTGLKGLAEQEVIELRALSPLGFEVNRWRLKRGAEPAQHAVTSNSEPLQVAETDNEYLVTAGALRYRFDKTGTVPLRIEKGGVAVVAGGPHLMLLQATKNADFSGHSPAVPASQVCSNWVPGKVTLSKTDASVAIMIPGSYAEATGGFVITVRQDGRFEVAYDFTVQKELAVLQIGSVVDLVPTLDHLYWKRKATLSVYPDEHIGRPQGHAPAFHPRVPLCGIFGPLSQPSYPWSHDATELGCNDFRSTKYQVIEASLRDKNGGGLFLKANGAQHLRCWVLKDKIRMLVADYSGYGSERHCEFGVPKTMKPGERVSGKAVFEVSPPPATLK